MMISSKFAAALLLPLAAGVAFAKPPVPIFDCGAVITEAGKYKVVNDLACYPDQQGIVVLASDVTIDLKGHTISCDASGDELVGAVLVGIPDDDTLVVENVWVKNGTVTGCDDGVLFSYSESGKVTKITAVGNVQRGITLLAAKNTIVKNNVGIRNGQAIAAFFGFDNEIKGNTLFDTFDAAINIDGETGALVACNSSERADFGMRLGPFSNGNVVRGNSISGSFTVGITAFGVAIPDVFFAPVASDNVIKNNVVQGSGFVDLSEVVLTPAPSVAPDAECANMWMKNQYVSQFGPVDCIAPPVALERDDVCALDDD